MHVRRVSGGGQEWIGAAVQRVRCGLGQGTVGTFRGGVGAQWARADMECVRCAESARCGKVCLVWGAFLTLGFSHCLLILIELTLLR